jgi:hypothetical protein
MCRPIFATPSAVNNNSCVSDKKIICPAGYAPYNERCERLPDTECQTDFILEKDTDIYETELRKINGLCMRPDERSTVCPYGENYKCIMPAGEEEYFCSNNACFDLDQE